MKMQWPRFGALLPVLLLLIAATRSVLATDYSIDLKTSGSVVLGGTVEFFATLLTDGKPVNDQYEVAWSDDLGNKLQAESKTPTFNWTVTYGNNINAGTYSTLVVVRHYYYITYLEAARKSISFNLTSLLNGQMQLTQNSTAVDSEYVSSGVPLNQTIVLTQSDERVLDKATYFRTYWFVNCQYIGTSDEFSQLANFTKENEEYTIEALVVISYDKLPEPTTTTTTTTTPKPTTTTSTTTTTQAPNTTTTTTQATTTTSTVPTTTSTSTSTVPTTTTTTKSNRRRRQAFSLRDTLASVSPLLLNMSDPTAIVGEHIPEHMLEQDVDSEELPSAHIIKKSDPSFNVDDSRQPFVCGNSSMVPPDPKKTYGHFVRKFIVQHPISKFNVTGSQWVHQGNMANLVFQCTGTPPFHICYHVVVGGHNITKNETCPSSVWEQSDHCNFQFTRFFYTPDQRSVLVFLKNHVSEHVGQVGLQFYENIPKSQLSIIVVPIGFCLLAVILVVFGVAYYIQNRERFIVEVADFNFGDTSSLDDDMEYKTFQQRLLDSLRDNLRLPRFRLGSSGASHDGDGDMSPSAVGESSLRYGSMT